MDPNRSVRAPYASPWPGLLVARLKRAGRPGVCGFGGGEPVGKFSDAGILDQTNSCSLPRKKEHDLPALKSRVWFAIGVRIIVRFVHHSTPAKSHEAFLSFGFSSAGFH